MEDLDPAPMTVVVPTPAGRVFNQDLAHELSARRRLVFACGRYEGIDQRVLDHCADTYDLVEVSLGDYVLNGGEAAVLAITEAVVRLIPGVLGILTRSSRNHTRRDTGCWNTPNYTKPPRWRGREVPEILLSGNHAAIATWRREQALERTRSRRPELLEDDF